MPVLLDTDHLTILQKEQDPEYGRLASRLRGLAPDDIGTTIVNFQEQMQGWLAYLSRARTPEQVVRAYAELDAMLRWFSRMNVLAFTTEAQEQLISLRNQRIRIGTLDLRIACIALVSDSTLLSRNLRDFRQIPGLQVEDWTR